MQLNAKVADQWLHYCNTSERCQVPVLVTNLPAGVHSSIRLTPWKESELTVLVQLWRQGFIPTKLIASHGIAVTTWAQAAGSKPACWPRAPYAEPGSKGNTCRLSTSSTSTASYKV
jgi:hypothetical protein